MTVSCSTEGCGTVTCEGPNASCAIIEDVQNHHCYVQCSSKLRRLKNPLGMSTRINFACDALSIDLARILQNTFGDEIAIPVSMIKKRQKLKLKNTTVEQVMK